MSVSFGSGTTVLSHFWTEFVARVGAKKLLDLVQYVEDESSYTIFVFDMSVVLTCTIWRGSVPDAVSTFYSQAQNDADKVAFETGVKPTANAPLCAQRQADGVPQVAVAPSVGSEIVIASHNFCDKCSWFGDSVRISDEVMTDSGDGLTFGSQHTHWVDMVSGRVHNDIGWVADQRTRHPEDPHGYQVIVKVNGVEQTMREPFEAGGGDYEVIWETGQVRFFAPPAVAPVASYSYASGSTFYLRPSSGKTLRILRAEADIAMGSVMTDTISYGIYALADAVAPDLVSGGIVPSGTMIPVGEIVYKRMGQIVAEAQGAYPIIEVLGSTPGEQALPIDEFRRKSRGTRSKVQAMPFNYSTSRDLSDAAQMEIRVRTKHDRAYDGDTVTITFYCVSSGA